jgi:hypothetical protein
MVKNQLFRKLPPKKLALKLLNAFGLEGFDDYNNFSRKDIEALGTVNIIERDIKHELLKYYLPCKAGTYLSNITVKNSITILRQILKVYNYTISSREKYIKGDKFIIYQLLPISKEAYTPLIIKYNGNNLKDCIVTFD